MFSFDFHLSKHGISPASISVYGCLLLLSSQIIQTHSSTLCRLLDSLTNFTNNLAITNSTSATFTRKTYALQVNDIDTSSFQGQTLNVDLGSVQDATSINSNLREAAIQVIEENKVFLNRTASVQVPASVFRDLGQSDVQQRLSYSVFVRDTLFQSSDENQSNLTVGSIIVAVRVNGSTASGNLSTPITVTLQASEVGGVKHNCWYYHNHYILSPLPIYSLPTMLQIFCVVVGIPGQMVCVNPYTYVVYCYVFLLRQFLNWWPEWANFTPNLVLIWFRLSVVTGELGAWITANSCENASSSSSSSSYLTRSTQPLQNSLGTTTRPTFIAQYPQPGYFAVLLVRVLLVMANPNTFILWLSCTYYTCNFKPY